MENINLVNQSPADQSAEWISPNEGANSHCSASAGSASFRLYVQHGKVDIENPALIPVDFQGYLSGNTEGWKRSQKLERLLDDLACEICAQTGTRATISIK